MDALPAVTEPEDKYIIVFTDTCVRKGWSSAQCSLKTSSVVSPKNEI